MRIDLWMTDVVTVVVGHGSGIRHFFPTDGSQPCPPHTWTVTTACPPSTYASGLNLVATWRQGDRRHGDRDSDRDRHVLPG
jgi:hypothetical protein